MFSNMRLVILFDIFLKTGFKMATCFTNLDKTTASASIFTYYEVYQIIKNWVCEKYPLYKK